MSTQKAAPDQLLSGKRVLITRARKNGAGLRSLLEARGATVVELPTVAIEPPEDLTALDDALRTLARYDWIAFTSRNAVDAVLTRLTALGLPAALPSHLRVAAVGAATAHELGSRGVPIHLVPAEGTAARLAVHMVGAGAGGTRILLPVGNLARPHLRRGLEEAGAQVDQVVAYRTVRPAEVDEAALEAVRRGDIDAVALASPSAIRHLVDLLGPHASCLQKARLACIGPTTAAEVRELGLEPSAVAGEHTLQGLVQAIASLFGERADEPI